MPTFGVAIRAIAARQGARIFRSATRDIQSAATGATVQVNRLNVATNRLGGSFSLIARSAAGSLASIAALAGIRSTIKNIRDFEDSINRARIIMGLTIEEFKPIRKQIRDMAVDTRFTAVEIADFTRELAQAGFVGKAAMDLLKPALDLAAAGSISLAKAQDIVIGTLRQFQFDVTEATRISNVFTKASFLTSATIEQLGEAFRKVGPLARATGLSFEQTVGILGILVEQIRIASRAGTNFRGVMASLLTPSKQVTERMEQLGFSIEDFSIIGGKVVEAMEKMKQSGADLGTIVKTLGRESIVAGLILSEAAPRIREVSGQLDNLGTFAENVAQQFEDTLAGSIRRLISAITDLQLEVGDSGLLGIMRKVVDFTRDVIQALKGVEDGFITNKKSVLGFVEVLKTMAVGGSVFIGLKAGIAILTTSVRLLTLTFAATGVGSIVVGISLAATAMFNLRKETVLFNGEVATIGDFAVATFTVLKDEINNAVEGMKKLVNNAVSLARIFKSIAFGIEPGVGGDTEARLRGGGQLSVLDRIAREAANRRRARELREQSLLNQLGTGPTTPSGRDPIKQIDSISKVITELTKQQQRAIRFAQEFGDTIGDSFSKMIRGAETAGEALKKLAADLLDLIIKQTLLQPLANTIAFGLTSTLGLGLAPTLFNPAAAFTGGIPTFAHGGIIGGPTLFRDGLAGEAGPEAVLPLKRSPSGDLGVVSSGGNNVVVNMTIQTPNADSFRKSSRQVFSDTQRLVARLR